MALRERFEQLPPGELSKMVRELHSEAGSESQGEARRLQVEGQISRGQEQLASLGPDPDSLERARALSAQDRIENRRAELAELAEVAHQARAELAAARHVLTEHEKAAATAARFSPPDYVIAELGERPLEHEKAATWDKAVRGIERYRIEHGVLGRDSALGPEPQDPSARHDHAEAGRGIERAQRELQLSHARSAEHVSKMEIGM